MGRVNKLVMAEVSFRDGRIKTVAVAVKRFGTKWPYEFMDDPFFGTKRLRRLPTSFVWATLQALV
jgi:hypothetical protein